MNATGIYCAIVWENDGTAHHEVICDGQVVRVPLSSGIPIPDLDDNNRHCTGYYDFQLGLTGKHVACSTSSEVEKGRQCRKCQFQEGFIALHAAATMQQVPAQLQEYVAQEHLLYLATFGNDLVKIGTAARSRHPARWYEQGALAATELTKTSDGIEVRRLESALSQKHSLTQSMRGSTKMKLLASLTSSDEIVSSLRSTLNKMASAGDIFEHGSIWRKPLDTLCNERRSGNGLTILATGTRQWDITSHPQAVGQCLVWHGPSGGYLMDVKSLAGRKVVFDSVGTGGQPQQSSLF